MITIKSTDDEFKAWYEKADTYVKYRPAIEPRKNWHTETDHDYYNKYMWAMANIKNTRRDTIYLRSKFSIWAYETWKYLVWVLKESPDEPISIDNSKGHLLEWNQSICDILADKNAVDDTNCRINIQKLHGQSHGVVDMYDKIHEKTQTFNNFVADINTFINRCGK